MSTAATIPVPLLRRLRHAALAGAVLSVPATLAAGILYVRVIDNQSEFAQVAGLSAAVVLDPRSMLTYVPIGAIVAIVVAITHRSLSPMLAIPLNIGLVALAGALVGWMFLYETPAIPLGLAVELVALSWGVVAAIAIAIISAKKVNK
jgi:hypothetical protein